MESSLPTFQKLNHRFWHHPNYPKQCKNKWPDICCEWAMKQQVVNRLFTPFAHTKPFNYQWVPLTEIINCQYFPQSCCLHKKHHLSWDPSTPYALPWKRVSYGTPIVIWFLTSEWYELYIWILHECFRWLIGFACRESWPVWIKISFWWSHLYRWRGSTLASFITQISVAYSRGYSTTNEMATLHPMHLTTLKLFSFTLLLCGIVSFFMLCPPFLIKVTLAIQRAGLFPTFDLLFMYSRVHPTNDLHQILVGFHSTIFVFFCIFCIHHLFNCLMSIDLYACLFIE